MVLFVIVCILAAVGLILVAYGTIAQNRWGINFSEVSCPVCKTPLSQVRKPRSLSQALWGGYTCMSCGTEIDKWGRQLERPSRGTNGGKVATP